MSQYFFFLDSVFVVLSSVGVNLTSIFVQSFKTSKKQRQAIKTIHVTIANMESKSKEIMGKIGKLDLHEIYLQVLNFMFWVKNNSIPSALQ